MKFDYLQIPEWISLLMALMFYRQLKAFKLLGIVLLLVFVCIAETLGANRRLLGLADNNIAFNFYTPIATSIYFWIFYKMLDFRSYVKTIYFVTGALVLLFITLNFLFLQGHNALNSYSLVMTEFIKSILALLVITKLFREDDYDADIADNPHFWISGGILIFGVSTLFLFGLQQLILLNKMPVETQNISGAIMPIVTDLLYCSFCYAFYLCFKKPRVSMR